MDALRQTPGRRCAFPGAAVLAAFALACATPFGETHAPLLPAPGVTAPGAPGAPVFVELTEVSITIDEQGDSVETSHDVYRVLSAEPPPMWAQAWAFWRPWTDEAPQLEATVVRPDGTVARLDPETQADQPEPRADGLITDARLRIAPLPGLAVGAVVDRRVTTRRRAHLVKGTSVGLALAGEVPEKKRVLVIDAPASVPLSWRVLNGAFEPRRHEEKGRVVLTFDLGATAPRDAPPPLAPPSAAAYPVLRVSTVKSWQEVAQAWTARAEAQLDVDAVRPLAREVTKGLEGREAKARALQAWVRKNVRYTGLELEDAAWIPAKTSQVIERKYGDCKDLSLLLVALLRAVDVPADVALVRSGGAVDADDGTPGLGLFDHAIVRLPGAPLVWADPTAPLLAFGELTGNLRGRKALVARPDTTALETIEPQGASRLDATVEVTFAEQGPARLRRVRESDGLVYAENRALAARSADAYRQALEGFVKEQHRAKLPPLVEASDPLGTGPFREVLEIADSAQARTSGEVAQAPVGADHLLAPLNGLLELDRRGLLKDRTVPVALPMRASGRVVNSFRPAPAYRLDELPESAIELVGPVKLALEWRRGAGDVVEAAVSLEQAPGELTADEARRLVDEVLPKIAGVRVTFDNVVLSAIKKQKYFTAVKEAEALLARAPTPVSRSLLAYALATATLQEAAEQEAKRAVADAPKDALVRNRATFVLLHNGHGVEFGKGYRRAEALELAAQTLELDPDNEWARRLHALTSLYDETGVFLGRVPGEDKVLAELREYRERTRASELDDELLTLLVRRRAWKELLDECPKLEQTVDRDAAWFAADVVTNGPEAALQRVAKENRASSEALGRATMQLMAAREYTALKRLLDALQKKAGPGKADNPVVRLITTLKPCDVKPEDPKAPFVSLVSAILDRRLDSEVDRIFSVRPTPAQRDQTRRLAEGVMGNLPAKGSHLGAFSCDFLASAVRSETKPLGDQGELVTLSSSIPGLMEPQTYVAKKTPQGWRMVVESDLEVATAGLAQLKKGNAGKAKELFRALTRLRKDTPDRLENDGPDFMDVAPFWAAVVVAQSEGRRAVAAGWLEPQLAKGELTEVQTGLLAWGLEAAWKTSPEKRAALGKKLQQNPKSPGWKLGRQIELRALRDRGAFAQARKIVEDALKKTPDDTEMLGLREHLAADVGDFATARRLAGEQAQNTTGRLAGAHLNNAAWYSIFDRPDDEAVRQAEQAVGLSASASHLNTLAAVYAGAEKWDEATSAFKRQQAAEDLEDEASLDPSYWWVRGRIAEAFGRPAAAAAAYRKMTRAKNGTLDDTYLLMEKRLKALPK